MPRGASLPERREHAPGCRHRTGECPGTTTRQTTNPTARPGVALGGTTRPGNGPERPEGAQRGWTCTPRPTARRPS
eukprot:685958-Alexandrium_andersonii.AAC.1